MEVRAVRKRGCSKNSSKRVLLFLKIALIWYVAMVTGMYLTSETTAQFNAIESIDASIHVNWEVEPQEEDWDKSSFQFVTIKGDCTKIEATFINKERSGDTRGPLHYEVRWAPSGHAKDGTIVKEEVLQQGLKSGETITLTHKPDKEGEYRFTLLQQTGHPGNSQPSGDISIGKCAKPKAAENVEKSEEGANAKESTEESMPKSDSGIQEATSDKEEVDSAHHNEQSASVEKEKSVESEVVKPPNEEEKKEGEESVEKDSEQ
ncbi:amyloid fiber anchoring/assembly protein TapA [Rossellomorea marisflavi]